LSKSAHAFRSVLTVLISMLPAMAATSRTVNRGPLTATRASTPISVTLALSLPSLAEAEKMQEAIYTPGSPQFHQFLTADQFAKRFAPSDADIAKVVRGLAPYRLTVEKATATTLKVTGMPADIERAFAVNLESYEVTADNSTAQYSFHAPLTQPAIPADLSSLVKGVIGLDDRPFAKPHHRQAPAFSHASLSAKATTAAGNPVGSLTVSDFARTYGVQPLYKKGINGKGKTLGILTFASFTPEDAYKYWQAAGLQVADNRIKIVKVDGGSGPISDKAGSMETTLDVEQSGGVAPKAKIVVYEAPNSSQGFVDVFAAAVQANTADSLSISWGAWEWLNNKDNSPVSDPFTGRTVAVTQAVHELLLRAAIQGQSVFASSGDGGAYDPNDSLACLPPYSSSDPDSCTLVLGVDYPASDTLITAAGGTTLPGQQVYCLNDACTSTYTVSIPHERVWGWDYLNGLCKALGYSDPISCGTFPAGGGGGVSISFALPIYQFALSGVQRSQPGQVLEADGIHYALPAYFPGRNVPDLSFNADPETGYSVFYTSSTDGFGKYLFNGGTSFVAPQLNGVAILLNQYLGGRVGLFNPWIYGLALTHQDYGGSHAPFQAIAYGNNWFYSGRNGYNPGAGLGVANVANLAAALDWGL
jgi:kumamolisin